MLALALALVLATLPYRVVLTDGSSIAATGPPAVRAKLAVVTLADGTVVSIPETRIDWGATERAVAADRAAATRAATAPASATPAATPAARASADLRQAARARSRKQVPSTAVIDNKVIADFIAAMPPGGVPRTGAPSALTEIVREVPSAPSQPRAAAQDDEGRGRAYWQERARTSRDAVRGAERELGAAKRSLGDAEDEVLHGRTVSSLQGGLKVTQFAQSREELALQRLRLSRLAERVRLAEARLEEARDRAADLQEEARQAGALPGWLVLPVAYR